MIRGNHKLMMAGLPILLPVFSCGTVINVPADQPTILAGVDAGVVWLAAIAVATLDWPNPFQTSSPTLMTE